MTDIIKLFFELIRVAIGNAGCLSRTPSADEWGDLYAMAKKQSLLGICFVGVQSLQKQEQCPPEMLYLQWMGIAAKVQQKNELVNRQCVEVQKRIEADGFRTYIMKGQANGALYGSLQMLRQSGDIDIYLEGGLDKVLAYARTYGEVTKVNELEMSVPVYKDTEVEFHFRPFIMRNPFKNRKLQRSFKEQMDKNFSEAIILDEEKNLSIAVPSIEFNLVHQMVHIYHHLFTEGIGLRQLMDYYFLLRAAKKEVSDRFKFQEVSSVVNELGLDRFASALMWVIGYVFEGNDNLKPSETLKPETVSWMPCVPSEKDGRVLLNEVMLSGNFGKHDERMEGLYDSKWNTFWMVNMKTFRFRRFDHWAWLWSPVWRVYHFIWKKINGFTK